MAMEKARDLEGFRILYYDIFGEEISVGEAAAMMCRLLPLYRQLMLKLPSERKITPLDAPDQPSDRTVLPAA